MSLLCAQPWDEDPEGLTSLAHAPRVSGPLQGQAGKGGPERGRDLHDLVTLGS